MLSCRYCFTVLAHYTVSPELHGLADVTVHIAGEIQTNGKGPLGQIGVPLDPKGQEYAAFALALWAGVFLVAAIGFNKVGEQQGSEEIY